MTRIGVGIIVVIRNPQNPIPIVKASTLRTFLRQFKRSHPYLVWVTSLRPNAAALQPCRE